MTYNPFKVDSTVFGESKFISPTPVIQIDNRYGIDPNEFAGIEIFTATGGAISNNGNIITASSGTSLGGYGVARSRSTANYKPGQSITARIVGNFTTGVALSEQGMGLFGVTDGLLFGYDGTDFSILHQHNGVCEFYTLQITATGAGTATVTLDGDAVNITTTNTTVEENAWEIKAGIDGDATLSGKWRTCVAGDTVKVINQNVGDKTGTFSYSSTGAAGTLTKGMDGAAKTNDYIAQASWDSAPYSGFDPTQINIYQIEYGYLGAVNARFSIYNPNNGEFETVHEIKWANTTNSQVILSQPNMKLGIYAASLGSTGTDLIVGSTSGAVFNNGPDSSQQATYSATNTKTSIGTTLTNVLSIKNRCIISDRYSLGKVKPIGLSVELDHTKGGVIEILRNPTVTGARKYEYVNEFNSVALSDTFGTTVTGGQLIDSFSVAAGDTSSVNLFDLNIELFPDEEIVIAARTVSGTSTSFTVSAVWNEDF